MPLYQYELAEGDCKICGGHFELMRPADRPELTHCPICRKAVRRVLGGFNTPKVAKPLSVSDAKGAGFTVLKRVDKGVYERQ
ncbi:MAG: zinc ribbon domain-containing protein [Verrucomicrobiae bacterium]|nr:zinc ribbon domain-containing protein [Verrucomicrobiae bacterium]